MMRPGAKIIYLASGNAKLEHDHVTYQDLIIKRDLGGDNVNKIFDYWIDTL